MKTIVRTLGNPPSIQTAASLNAPAGAKALADLLADEDFADICTIDIDWEGDGITPALTIYTIKFDPRWAPENLQHFWPIDINEAFGQDHMTNSTLRDIVSQLKEHFIEATNKREHLEKSGQWKRPGENVKYYER